MFDRGSTAVLSTPHLPFIVSVKKAGIYAFEDGEWLLQYGLSQNIYRLVHLGQYIFGIGDCGTIVRYDAHRKKWTHTSFPTSQRLWDVTGNKDGLIVTHSGSKLYISRNFGSTWSLLKPFRSLDFQPLIRSLFYYKNHIYIGTQINRQHGGLWKYSLESGELLLLKKEEYSMISSIYIDSEEILYITKGNALSGTGSVEICCQNRLGWLAYQSPLSEKAFLDLFVVDKKLYATTSKDDDGFSRIYEVDKDQMVLVPIETVLGHGFRGAGYEKQLFISSPVESKWVHNFYEIPKVLH